MLAVKDVSSAKSYLIGKQYLSSVVDFTVSQLVGVLSLIVTDKATSHEPDDWTRLWVSLGLHWLTVLTKTVCRPAASTRLWNWS